MHPDWPEDRVLCRPVAPTTPMGRYRVRDGLAVHTIGGYERSLR
jgi:hypothetical protein